MTSIINSLKLQQTKQTTMSNSQACCFHRSYFLVVAQKLQWNLSSENWVRILVNPKLTFFFYGRQTFWLVITGRVQVEHSLYVEASLQQSLHPDAELIEIFQNIHCFSHFTSKNAKPPSLCSVFSVVWICYFFHRERHIFEFTTL